MEPSLRPAFDVVLRHDLPRPERELLATLCCELEAPSGESLLHFRCTRIDLSHHVFAELDVLHEGSAGVRQVRVPHHFICLIAGDAADRPIGFTAIHGPGP